VKAVRFWGTRGSLPVALTAAQVRQRVGAALRRAAGRSFASDAELDAFLDTLGMAGAGTYGGHTSCVELVTGGDEYVLCDLGTGVRPFGQQALARHGAAKPQTYHVFMSHVHWDHIMGFPFFVPAYIPGNRIRIYSGHAMLEEALRRQSAAPSFPADFSVMGATIEFVHLEPGRRYDIAGMEVSLTLQQHGGDSFGYRFSRDGRTVVYSTDSEHRLSHVDETLPFVELFRDADVVVFDGMYSLSDSMSIKADWGHSSNIVGVELCQMAAARHLVLFHHEPLNDDATIERILAETRRYEELSRTGVALRVSAAYDGMEIAL